MMAAGRGEASVRDVIAAIAASMIADPNTPTAEEMAQKERQEALRRRVEALPGSLTVESKRALLRGALEPTDALTTVELFTSGAMAAPDRPVRMLAMVGPKGRGKSVAAAWAYASHPSGARFILAPELRRWATSVDWREQERLNYALDTGLLVIDDLGTEALDKRTEEFMNLLFNTRTGRDQMRTIITSNLDEPTLEKRYGDRIMDRLRDQGAVLAVAGHNMRRPGL